MKSKSRSSKWLLLLYQIPTKSETERVRIWRALQKLGAVSVKNSVTAVPDTSFFKNAILEVATDITSIGGEAILTEGNFIFGLDENSLLQTYSSQLDVEYKNLAKEIREASKEVSSNLTSSDLMKWEHKRTRFQSKLNALVERSISSVDGEDQCNHSLTAFEKKLSGITDKAGKKDFVRPPVGSVWVTRKDPHVDRLASAWLIKRFIDPKAEIRFVDMDKYSWDKSHVRFDVFNAEFGHVGEQCTFEVLIARFKIKRPAVRVLAEIVHDLDIQDQKYDRRETEGIRMALDGVIRGYRNDEERLQSAMSLLDSLTLSLK
jgi:hypothetical protein